MAAASISQYVEWLTRMIEHYARYHDHKERMAWVATALYVPSIVTLGFSASKILNDIGPKIFASIVIVLVWGLIFMFINMQFRMRWKASDRFHALRLVVGRLCSGSMPLKQEQKIKNGEEWPIFIQNVINRVEEENKKLRSPKLLFKNIFRWTNVDDRWKTEFPSQAIIGTMTIIALFLIYL